MERICSQLFPKPTSNPNVFTAYIDHHASTQSPDLLGFNRKESSCYSCLPQGSKTFNGGMGYQTPKLDSSGTRRPAAKKGSVKTQKNIHKYAERERRKEMKALCSSLRSLLPDEHVTGRLSTVEQLSETSNCTKTLQKMVKELTQQRDEMRKEKLCETLPFSASSETFPVVDIQSVGSGVLVSASAFKCQIICSDLLATLENNGLDIISASCNAVNDKVFHIIHAKVSDVDRFESRNLYGKIWNLVGQNSSDADQVES